MAKINNRGEESFNNTELYLTYYPVGDDDDKDVIRVPLLTLVTVFVVKVAGIRNSNVKIVFKATTRDKDKDDVTFCLKRDEEFNFSGDDDSKNDLVDSCILPALYVPAYRLCVTGLCSVLRRLLKTGDVAAQSFLGHQGSCLSAPAEVSSWTRFCEIDLPTATLKFLAENYGSCDILLLPNDLARFEEHMNQPIKMHNIRKRMGKMTSSKEPLTSSSELDVTSLMQNCKILENGRQVAIDEQGREVDPIELFARSQHVFAEGPDCLLSDLILFPHVHLVFTKLFSISSEDKVAAKVPLTLKWYKKMLIHHPNALDVLSLFQDHLASPKNGEGKPSALKLPEVPAQSLYKSDPKRSNPASRLFTRQHEVERVLAKVSESTSLELLSSKIEESGNPEKDGDVKLDWTSFPRDVHPMGGELPLDRVEKKCHQLENMATAVLNLVRDGDRIVDFCSGGGHLGIVLAYLMPTAIVYLVENKEESLMRAVKRVQRLGLTNCRFFQGNMDYFSGEFEVGVSLHACGVATDLVIRTCIENKASFVCCPCCYGSVQENHILSYPRSKRFQEQSITFQEYLILGHTADQTHVTNVKHNQGQFAMDTVDSDRVHFAREAGYSEVILSKMKPENCTPKNNLIVAAFST